MKRKTDKDDYGLQTEFERIVREHKAAITGEFPGEEQCGHMDMEGQPQHLHFIREEAQAQAGCLSAGIGHRPL